MTAMELTEDQHARLIALLSHRRRLESRRKRSKHIAARQFKTLAEKVAVDRRFADEMAELNRQIEELTEATGGTTA